MSTICHLLRLPAELRIRIYENIFDLRDDKARSDYHAERYGNDFDLANYPAGLCKLELSARGIIKSCSLGEARLRASPLRNFTAILQTCHLINGEAADVLYAQTYFRITCGTSSFRGKLLCASRNACFNFRHTSIYERTMIQLLRQAQNAEVLMQFDREAQFFDVLPAVDVLLSALSLTKRARTRVVRITLTEWLPSSIDAIHHWDWYDILELLKGMRFACVPEIVAHPCPWTQEGKMKRLRELTQAARGVLIGDEEYGASCKKLCY